ncbi:hypothetical protein SH661x_002805 [Planctomicrobium sp. SH661]|uniref:hypothetical protein n=1 Tax=Planctomicrobium sp. SH661 TaxID=3448124 RepID=UPI003F5B49FA
MTPPMEAGSTRPGVEATIQDGKYEIERALGPMSGEHLVIVTIYSIEFADRSANEGGEPPVKGTYFVKVVVPEGGSDMLDINVLKTATKIPL